MKFPIEIKLTDRSLSRKIRRKEIERLLRQKESSTRTDQRTIRVLITDRFYLARQHSGMHDTLTIVLITESTRVVDDMMVSYPEDLLENLSRSLARIYPNSTKSSVPVVVPT